MAPGGPFMAKNDTSWTLLCAIRKQKSAFQPRKATFRGNGLHPDAAGASSEKIREMSYGGRDE